MAVIQKIRTKYAKLAGFVIALSLVGFLLMDAGDNIRKIFSGSEYVAKVNGEKIEPKDYMQRITEIEGLYETMGNKLDDNTRAQVHSQVLSEMIYEKAVQEEMEKLGITLTKEEEKEMITGANRDPMVMQFPLFKNPETGMFDEQRLIAFEQKKIDPNQEGVLKAYEQWDNMKAYIKRQRLTQKYNALFAEAVNTPNYLLQKQMKDQMSMASAKYVKIPFTNINDNEVKVTDADLNDYIKRHEAQYKIEDPTRSIDYVAFDANPSAEDSAKVTTAINTLKAQFAEATDNESFVNRNSDDSYNDTYVGKKTFMSQYADSILNKPVGVVYGPYFENGAYRLAKITERKTLPDSVKFRQISVSVKVKDQDVMADSIAKRKIDSIQLAINTGANFIQVYDKYSDRPSNGNPEAGQFEVTLQQMPSVTEQLSQEFTDFLLNGKAGEKKVIKISNDNYTGYHYVELVSQKAIEPVVKLAIVSKKLEASQVTTDASYAKAIEFAGKHTTDKAFDEAIKTKGLNKLVAENIKANDFVLPGLGSSREIIRWMYGAKKGEVSPVFSLEGRYVVAKLSAMHDKGLVQIDASNRSMFESQVKAEKKAALIAQKYKGATTIDAISQAAAQPVQALDSFNAASAYLPNLGYEPKVVGYAFYEGYKIGTLSPGIKGGDGVFFLVLTNRQAGANVPVDQNQMAQQAMMQTMQLKNGITNMLSESVRRTADIKYDVNNLY